ncbi:hypothetical protein K504DRAFT_387520 [Pleomassaria siparia CBS 279.74]|uniref:Lytic polysaccharide monooxygenase n=1 Tax=Pleomassaria siparia CBS 279.74 TaxID=1314801 RepID=A0A6G1JYQ1_9PLEO|nr:hypothetical protein K504DRAFT_387520 [Pleomassaria siparia CBS 279.74]
MQYLTLAASAALIATASASSAATAFNLNSTCIESEPKARVYNRCSYPVYLWSVVAGPGCPTTGNAVIQPGEFYQENYRPAVGAVGTSLKISKTEDCDANNLLQLEYYIETKNPGFNYNYLDVSYVNCPGKECPTASEGFYLKSGNDDGKFTANSLNNICPILSCSNWASCSKVAYVNWDDVQTKSCDPSADLDFYMCGGEAPGADTPTVAASSAAATTETPTPTPSSTSEKEAEPTSTAAAETSAIAEATEVAAAAITPAAVKDPKPAHIKTEVVYVTEIAYVNAKRHEHGHRHQHFRA